MTRIKRISGFTLLEVMIVLVLVSLLAVGSQRLLSHTILVWQDFKAREERISSLERDIKQLRQDFSQATPRSVLMAQGRQLAFSSDGLVITFSRIGFLNQEQEKRSELEQVRYEIAPNGLSRSQRLLADNTTSDYSKTPPLLRGASDVQIQVMDEESQWSKVWPPLRNPGQPQPPALPKAVEISFVMPPYGRLSRVIRIMAP